MYEAKRKQEMGYLLNPDPAGRQTYALVRDVAEHSLNGLAEALRSADFPRLRPRMNKSGSGTERKSAASSTNAISAAKGMLGSVCENLKWWLRTLVFPALVVSSKLVENWQ